MSTFWRGALTFVVFGTSLCVSSPGCATRAQEGALIGGAGGAAVGAGIGSLSHARAGEGALIGAAVGTVGGYIVGNEMDKAEARERERQRTVYATRTSDRVGGGSHAEPAYDEPAGRPVYGTPTHASAAAPSAAASASTISKREVIRWTSEGVKDEIIIDRIERCGSVARVTATDENEMRDAGVSEEVVRAMKDAAWRR